MVQDFEEKGFKRFIPHLQRTVILHALRQEGRDSIQKAEEVFKKVPLLDENYNNILKSIFSDEKMKDEHFLQFSEKWDRKYWKKFVSNDKTREKVITELETFLREKNLDPQAMFAAWKASSNNSDEYHESMGKKHVYMRNVASIASLEQEQPGICAYFNSTWGVTTFSRYPVEVLKDIYAREQEYKNGNSGKKRKQMLILYPCSDWNGAFETPEFIKKVSLEAKWNNYNLHIAEAGKKFGCMKNLARCSKRYGPIDAAVIGGHATETSMRFGPGQDDTFSLSDLAFTEGDPMIQAKEKAMAGKLRDYFSPNAQIYLKACSTGKEGGLAERISGLFKISTHGPANPSRIKNIDLATSEPTYEREGSVAVSHTYIPSLPTRIRNNITHWLRKMRGKK